MNLTDIKAVTSLEMKTEIKCRLGKATLDYPLEAYIEEICSGGLYKEGKRKRRSKYRITFPLFILAITILYLLMGVKWLFTGSFFLSPKSYVLKKILQWNDYCGFHL